MVEFYGHQPAPARDLLAIVEKTTWVTGQDLLTVNLEYSPYTTQETLVKALQSEIKNLDLRLTIQEFHSILARILFDHNGLWGDKTPDYGYYMTMIQALWPKCRFVHIVRDGLATAMSMSRHPGCQHTVSGGYDNWCSLSYDGLYKQYSVKKLPLEPYVQSWRRRLVRIRDEASRLSPNSYLEVRYEHLLEDPSSVLETICKFLNLSPESSWLVDCGSRVRKNRLLADFNLSILSKLEPEDLRALHSCRPAHFLLDPTTNNLEGLKDLYKKGAQALQMGEANLAAKYGLSMHAHTLIESQPLLAAKGAELVRMSLHELGEMDLADHWDSIAKREAPNNE